MKSVIIKFEKNSIFFSPNYLNVKNNEDVKDKIIKNN